MRHIERSYRLTNEPGGLGLSCTPEGLSLAGVALLRKIGERFAARPQSEISAILYAAYGPDYDADDLLPRINLIAHALNRHDDAQAATSAVLLRISELDWDAAVRVAKTDDELRKYDPDQARDVRGRWTTEEGGAPSNDPPADDDEDDVLDDSPNQTPLERKYDNLGPIAFAKEAIQFGDWLGRQGAALNSDEEQNARAEYDFVQSRLSMWLAYGYKPPEAQANLLSASLSLYEGAVNAGIVTVGGKHGDLPQSMVVVGSTAVGLDNSQPVNVFRRPVTGTPFEDEPPPLVEPAGSIGQFGNVVLNTKAKINWSSSAEEQGLAWEKYRAETDPQIRLLLPRSKTFDEINEVTDEAISDKTLNTQSAYYIQDPREIFNTIKKYIDRAAEHAPRLTTDFLVSDETPRAIHLAIPEYTSPTQWKYLQKALRYAEGRGVSLIVTRIRD